MEIPKNYRIIGSSLYTWKNFIKFHVHIDKNDRLVISSNVMSYKPSLLNGELVKTDMFIILIRLT